ncbi:MAG: polyprenol phosphomannose-dependent alpha 1,6 mannosyltransferase MptB, partial [Acidimicrobiales bacterium]
MGLAGSLLAVLAGATVGSVPRPPGYRWWVGWWGLGYSAAHVVLYVGVALLTLAWVMVGALARRGELSVARALTLLVAWATPLALGVPLFSRDVYSYAADAVLARRGLNPYVVAPDHLGGGPLYASIAQVWRHTPSPYGPLIALSSRALAPVAGSSLMAEVLVARALELVAFAVLAVALVAIARRHHVDPGVALWLGTLSPLALFSAVSSAHNDTLMLAVASLGVVASQRGARRSAIALFALAATVKLPGLAGVVVVSAGAWRGATAARRARVVAEALVIVAAVLALVTWAAGDGWTWLSPHALAIPTELHVLITPVVAVGALAASIARGLGDHVATRGVVVAAQHVGEALAALGIVGVVLRTRADNAVRALGLALALVAWLSPVLWPWYLLWGLTALAATTSQGSR